MIEHNVYDFRAGVALAMYNNDDSIMGFAAAPSITA